jgi:hypothetical protein
MGLDSFQTEGPRTYTEDKEHGPTIENTVVHAPKGSEIPDGLLPDNVEVHRIVMRENALSLKLSSGSPYYICGECGSVSGSPVPSAKVDKIEFWDEDSQEYVNDWAEEWFEWVLDKMESIPVGVWEERCDTDFSKHFELDKEEDVDEEEFETDTSGGSGLDSFMS